MSEQAIKSDYEKQLEQIKNYLIHEHNQANENYKKCVNSHSQLYFETRRDTCGEILRGFFKDQIK